MHARRDMDNRCNGRNGSRNNLAATFYPQLDVTAFQLELGDVLFNEKIYEFFDFFLVHGSVVDFRYSFRGTRSERN